MVQTNRASASWDRLNAALASFVGPPLFVWGIWAVSLMGALAFVTRFGIRSVPYGDEWDYISGLTGERSITPAWLWAPHGEHSIPLPKLIWAASLRATDFDFRAGVYLDALARGGVALALILAAKSQRGRLSYSDAFFPLAILTLGQAENLYWWWQVNQIMPPALACILLVIIVRYGTRLTHGVALLAATCLVLLSLSGPPGLPYVLTLSAWVAYWALFRRSSPAPRWRSVLILLLTGLALLQLALALRTTATPGYFPRNPGVIGSLKAMLQLLSNSLGPATISPLDIWRVAGLAVLGLLFATTVILVIAWRRRPAEHPRVLGLLLFMGGTALLTVSLGWARAGWGEFPGIQSRYMLFFAPALCSVYFAWQLYGPAGSKHFIPTSLFTTTCILFIPNVDWGLESGIRVRAQMDAFLRDVRAGMPPFVLAERHGFALYPWFNKDEDPFNTVETVAGYLRKLGEARIGAFRQLQRDPAFRERRLAVEPIALHEAVWKDSVLYGVGTGRHGPSATFALDAPQVVYAVRVKYRYLTAADSVSFEMVWTGRGGSELGGQRVHLPLRAKARDETLTIWVNDTIGQFRIHPDDRPAAVKISELLLLIPAAGPRHSRIEEPPAPSARP